MSLFRTTEHESTYFIAKFCLKMCLELTILGTVSTRFLKPITTGRIARFSRLNDPVLETLNITRLSRLPF